MPTIFILDGFRFFFYSGDENEPIHVHVEKGDGIAKVWLEPNLEPQYFVNFKAKEVKRILQLCEEHAEFLKDKWNEYFSLSVFIDFVPFQPLLTPLSAELNKKITLSFH